MIAGGHGHPGARGAGVTDPRGERGFDASRSRKPTATRGFSNDRESLFEAVQDTPVDFLGKTCGMACAKPEYDLSRFILDNRGFFDTRDEVFEHLGSFHRTLRGRLFEMVLGGRKSF